MLKNPPPALAGIRRNLDATLAGFKGQTSIRTIGVRQSLASTSGVIILNGIFMQEGDLVSNGFTCTSVSPSSVTTIKMGLYDTAGNRLAISSNVTTARAALGPSLAHPFTTPYLIPLSGQYFLAALIVASTPGNMGASFSVTTGLGNNPTIAATGGAGQTDLPSTVTIASSLTAFWMAWS